MCLLLHQLSLGAAGIRESQIFAALSAGHYIYVRICILYRLVCYYISLRVCLHSQNTCSCRTITRIETYFSIETYKGALFRFNLVTGKRSKKLTIQLQKRFLKPGFNLQTQCPITSVKRILSHYNDAVPLLGGVRGI